MKWYDLKKGDKFKFDNLVVAEFIKIDGMYGKWKIYNKDGELLNKWETFYLDGELEKQGEYYVIKEGGKHNIEIGVK